MSIDTLKKLEITEEDINWVETAMGSQIKFDSTRRRVIKNMKSVDIQAFPGSGKTTVLVAKLAILAKSWAHTNSGICVLSHTNVAREEIEERLGKNEVGKKILLYPHFVGTFQSFFDIYVAMPWMRSKGLNIDLINSEYVQSLRWSMLPSNIQIYLKRQNKNESICSYKDRVGKVDLDSDGSTKKAIINVIKNTQKKGYFTFSEMFLYAKQALLEWDEIPILIQQRFPILFIDEAQDTTAFQWDLLKSAFNKDETHSIKQAYGDSNQSIYENPNSNEDGGDFPREGALILNESRRFDAKIATLANTVAVSKEEMEGTDNFFSKKNFSHTIFLFPKERASEVINEFGQLILDTFSDEELHAYPKEGCHVVGMVHLKKEETPTRQFPKGIYDYWNIYEGEKNSKNIVLKLLIQYFRYGLIEFLKNGEKEIQIEWIAKGLRRIINEAKNSNYIPASDKNFTALLKPLSEDESAKLRRMFIEISDDYNEISKSKWALISITIKKILVLFNIPSNYDCEKWLEYEDVINQKDTNNLPNRYIYTDQETQRSICMEFGSIHSVKGRTHLATLVLETFMQTHNIKAILKNLYGEAGLNYNKITKKRLRCQYVAMTRPRALLCLAIPAEFVDEKAQIKLQRIGWDIKMIE